MRKSIFATFTAAVAVAAALLLTGCERAIDMTGRPVSFAAGISDGASGPKTRVAYGAEESNYQALDWQEGDHITIYCEACEDKKSAVYKVQDITEATTGNMVSYAGLANAESDGAGLRWGTGAHTFYAVYPQASATAPVTTIAGNVITGTIPASQGNKGITGTDAKVVAPDMRNMYMTAKKEVSAENVDGDVELDFKPLTTVLEFTITKEDSEKTMDISSISLTSKEHALSGGFKVDMNVTGLYDSPNDRPKTELSLEGGQTVADCNTVTISFGSNPVELKKEQSLTFTFFLNPGNDVNDLTFSISGKIEDEIFTRKTALNKSDGTGIAFPTHKKSVISGLMLPDAIAWTVNYDPTITPWDDGVNGDIQLSEPDYVFVVNEDSHTFYVTAAQETATFNVTSAICAGDEPVENVGWTIKSVKVGSNPAQTIDGASFSGIGGLSAETTVDGNLKLTAAARTPANPDSHDYWTNNGGISGDTEGTGWSPKDWSSTIATTSSPLDLSKFNFKTETSQAMTTANCYIVRHAGTYKIPLVYGNGVVGGNENTRSYKPTLSGNTQPLSPLVDYLNQGITSAFIENKPECVPTGCAILWQDEAVVVKDLAITGTPTATYNASNVRYLQFTVDPSTICQNNALICIYKDKNGNGKYDSGEAIWSWHIWTTNNPALLADAIPVTNYSGRVYNYFPIYNIGNVDKWIYFEREQVIITLKQTESGKTTTITVNQPLIPGPSQGNYYQFGRKDPMCRKNTPASGAFYIKDASLTDIYVNKAITEPDTFFGCTPYYNLVGWYTWAWPNANLWSGKATYSTSYENDSDIFKTIYDPSPVGYKVPASKAFTGFTTTGAGTATPSEYNVSYFSNGYFFYTNSSKSDVIYFPASGYRHSETGVITDLGGRGSYWAAISGNESSGYQLLFYNGNSSGIAPDNFERRANGQSVRPVLE